MPERYTSQWPPPFVVRWTEGGRAKEEGFVCLDLAEAWASIRTQETGIPHTVVKAADNKETDDAR